MYKIKILLPIFIVVIMLVGTAPADINIKTQSVEVDGQKIVYNTAGKGNCNILFLHGLFANKEQWTSLMKYFAEKGYFVLAPDLPGYGKSSGFPLEVYTINNQVALINKFVKNIGIKKFNLAGNSLGCAVAMAYTQKYKNDVETVALLGGPAGLGKLAPEIMNVYMRGGNPFIPLSIKEFNEEMNLLFFKAPKIPEEVILKIITDYKNNYKKYVQIFNIFNFTIYNFAADYKINFKKPTLIVWGNEDHILTADDAELAKE
jgi:abhydrolase domain-containing protein 6